MSVDPILRLRREELRRRVQALPAEVEAWRQRTTSQIDMEVHFSQLSAISTLMKAYANQQGTLLIALDPARPPVDFAESAFTLVKSIISSQRIWNFFRSKLELRFSEKFKDVLWTADTIAWNCYRPVMDDAINQGIVDPAEVREPPLTYLTPEFSPATWVRRSRPNDGRAYHLGEARLPIPVIEVPFDHIENLWELLSLHHEVGHDLEADLKLRTALTDSLRQELSTAGVPAERVGQWVAWEGEIVADLIALQLAGPAYTEMLVHLLLLPAAAVTELDPVIRTQHIGCGFA